MLIKVSRNMSRQPDSVECRLARVPWGERLRNGWEVGEFKNFEGRDGRFVTLQIAEAFWSDVLKDEHSIYVAENTFKQLNVNNICTFKDVTPINGITLGCDPEIFVANRRNEIQRAILYFPDRFGPIGFDGWMVELRPLPSEDELTLLNNLAFLIIQARQHLDKFENGYDLRLVGLSHAAGASAGFHLHYGIPKLLLGRGLLVRSVARQIVKVLDYYVGIVSIIPEGQEDSGRRTFELLDYGKPGTFRLDNRTLEYRVPGGHMMRHPLLTLGLITIGSLVIRDVVSRINATTNNMLDLMKMSTYEQISELYEDLPSSEEIRSIIVNDKTGRALECLAKIKEDYKDMVGYEQKAHIIEAFLSAIESGQKFSENIEDNWREFYHEEQQKPVVFRKPSCQAQS